MSQRRSSPPRRQSAVTLLEEDHARLRTLLGQLESARQPARRATLFAEAREAITVHCQVEEEILHPAFHAAARTKEHRKVFFESAHERATVDRVLINMSRGCPAEDAFAAQAHVLRKLVEFHAHEVERGLFPAAQSILPPEALLELGDRIRRRRRELSPDLDG